MYRITADYHTHTRYSHGKGSIEDNVKAALQKGLKEIAIADHGFGHIGFGISIKDLCRIREEINRMNDKYKDIKVLMGIEANLTGLNGEIDIPDEYLTAFDIILMGFHKAVWPHSWKDGWNLFIKNGLNAIVRLGGEKLRHENTMAMVRAMEKYPINIITHPGAKINIDTKVLARHAAKKNIALEINASHGFMTAEYVKIAMKEGASFVINSDAHVPKHVGMFDRGVEIARNAGLRPNQIINAEFK